MRVIAQSFISAFGPVEPQARLPLVGIGAVAFIAFIGKDGADIKVVAYGVGDCIGDILAGGRTVAGLNGIYDTSRAHKPQQIKLSPHKKKWSANRFITKLKLSNKM